MTTTADPTRRDYSHINGSSTELLARLAVSEICKGWPVYLDNCEWGNFKSLFAPGATVSTSWSGTKPVSNFVDMCKAEKDKGVAIHHRENGTLVELKSSTRRAVGKMKVTITHRFSTPGGGSPGAPPIAYDVDCDCRMLFFCRFVDSLGGWKAQFVKVVYEKDKVCPVDGKTVPEFDPEVLARYPQGYRYLGAAQELLGYKVNRDLPVLGGPSWFEMHYASVEKWLMGEGGLGLFNHDEQHLQQEVTEKDESWEYPESAQSKSSKRKTKSHSVV